MHDFWELTSSALSVNSSGPSLIDTSGHPSLNFGLSTSKGIVPSFKMAHIRGRVVVNFNKVSQALHNSFPSCFTKASYNTLDWVITIFLLVRQQLERIDQIFTQTLRCRMRFKNLCLTGTNTICSSTDRAPPAAVLCSGRYPPNVVLQRKPVTMWAQIRQSDISLSSGWREDTPQEICALQHNSLHDAQASHFILCHFSKVSRVLSKVHSVAFTSTLKVLL